MVILFKPFVKIALRTRPVQIIFPFYHTTLFQKIFRMHSQFIISLFYAS